MISLLISVALFGLIYGGAVALHWYWGYGVALGAIAFFASNFVLSRTIGKKVEARMQEVGQAITKGRPDQAIEILKGTQPLTRWQFMLRGQLDGQIGAIYYAQRKFDDALPYLERASNRHWMARAMLGITYFKRNRFEEMDKVFQKTIAANRKEGMLASLYAYCLVKRGDADRALEVLNAALKKLEGDARLTANITAVQNKRPLKMKAYGDAWYQFHLERPPGMVQGQIPKGPPPKLRRRAVRR
jgi:tetratricopeptide (TPR) repeat protein